MRPPSSGSELAVVEFGSTDPIAPTLLAIHGITSNGMAWQLVADLLPGWRVIAPDLRGRGRSNHLGAPFGLRQHAIDLAGLLDARGIVPTLVAGHSMGAFVAVALAAHRPDLVHSLVLVDGGLPLALPAGKTPADIGEFLGPAAARLAMTFPDEEAYLALWRAHPAFVRDWREEVASYARYDLHGSPPDLRASASAEAMLADGAELYGPDWYLDALHGLRVPVDVLRAPRGLVDTDPLYAPGALEAFADVVRHLRVTEVLDVNHYTILFSDRGARSVADTIIRMSPEHRSSE